MGHEQRCTWPSAVWLPKGSSPPGCRKPPHRKICCFLITRRRTSMYSASQTLRLPQHRGETPCSTEMTTHQRLRRCPAPRRHQAVLIKVCTCFHRVLLHTSQTTLQCQHDLSLHQETHKSVTRFIAMFALLPCSGPEPAASARSLLASGCLPGAGPESQLCHPWPGRSHAGWLQGRLGTLGDGSLVWLVLVNPASGTLRSWWLFIPGAAPRVVSPSPIFPVLPVCIQVHLAGPVLSDKHDSAT